MQNLTVLRTLLRPITLMNCEYKIPTKAIANRLKKVLLNLVDNDFLKIGLLGRIQ